MVAWSELTRVGDFWDLLDDVEPMLGLLPVADLVRLVENPKQDNELDDPVSVVERALDRPLTLEERGLVMLKVLASSDRGTPSEALRYSFTRAAEQEEPWAAAISVGALGA